MSQFNRLFLLFVFKDTIYMRKEANNFIPFLKKKVNEKFEGKRRIEEIYYEDLNSVFGSKKFIEANFCYRIKIDKHAFSSGVAKGYTPLLELRMIFRSTKFIVELNLVNELTGELFQIKISDD